MNIFLSLIALLILIFIGIVGIETAGLDYLFGVIIPYAAIVIFLGGIVYRVIHWAKSPVPFRIPTVAGQQKSLKWIKQNKLDSPHSTMGVIGRMLLEILFFQITLQEY